MASRLPVKNARFVKQTCSYG